VKEPEADALSQVTKRRKSNVQGNTVNIASLKSTDVLTFKRLTVNMCLLGVIREINQLDLVVSLPDQLTGYVSITEISKQVTATVESAAAGMDDNDGQENDLLPKLHEIFTIGQPIPCCIVGLETTEPTKEHPKERRRIELSLMPERVNGRVSALDVREGMTLSACISSQEDHGFAVSFGIEGLTGFLNNKLLDGNDNYKPGHLIYCSIVSVNEARRVASVSLQHSTLSTSQIKSPETMLLESLTPGLLVPAKVRHITSNGLVLSFYGIFEGVVDLFHTGRRLISLDDDLRANFKVDQKIQARILYIEYERKRIGLTLRSNLASWRMTEMPATLAIGTIVEEAVVARVDSDTGVLLDVPGAPEGAYCHVSRLSDTHLDKIDKKYRPSTKHRARVIGMDLCDELVQVSLQPSVLAQTFFRHEDLSAGMMVKGRVLKLESYGMLVALTENIRGLCPRLHLADVVLRHPELKFKIDGSVKCRVLSVNVKTKRLILTHKKSLMNSTLPILNSYDDATAGMLTDGIITAVKDFGCIITFYNDVKALAPASELSDAFVNHPSDLFTVGQVVRCRVLTVHPKDSKMRVTLKPSSILRSDRHMDLTLVKIGQVVSGTILAVESNEAILELSPSGVHGLLSSFHLTDIESNEIPLFSILKPGMEIPELVVISHDAKRGRVHVSRKPWLLHAARQVDSNGGKVPEASNITAGSLLAGFVRTLQKNACFVHFLGEMFGAVKIHNLSDQYVSDISQHVRIGKSVVALVTDVDSTNNRLSLCTKSSQIHSHPQIRQYELVYVRSLFNEMDILATKSFVSLDGNLSEKVGDIWARVQGAVKQKLPFGYTVELDGGFSGVLTTENAQKQSSKPARCLLADNKIVSVDELQVGQAVVGMIVQLSQSTGLQIQLAPQLYGRVHLTDIADTYSCEVLKDYKVGQYVKSSVIDVDVDRRRVDLSLRPSRMGRTGEIPGNDEIRSIDDVQQDTVVSGFVKNISGQGVFVALNRKMVARVKIADLSDAFVKDWKSLFKVGQLVRGRILSVNLVTSRVEMSLKASVVNGSSTSKNLTLSDLKVGQKLGGTVKAIQPYGIFICIGGEGSTLSGLCHLTQVSDTPVKDISTLYSVGDTVKAVILNVDESKKHIKLGLKASYFDVDDITQVDEDEKVNEGQMHATYRDVGSHDEDQNGTIEGEETSECSVDDSRMALDGAADDQDEKMQNAEHQNEPAPVVSQSNLFLAKLAGVEALEVDGSSFNWMMPMSDDGRQGKQHVPSEDEDDDNKDSTTTSNKTSSKKKDSKRLKKEREEAISRQERLLLDPDRQPETVEDYERMLLGSPNSSLLWIQYMAFVLQLAEIDKARAIAERALKVINFREEGEKMNVWVAYLNLEYKFGTQESLKKVFERGVAYNDPKSMHLQMARIYERTDKVELADELYTSILKKFKESSKCWTSAALFYLRNSRIEDARRLLQRCLLSLPKHKHVKTISKFAQMEFRHGDAERGRTIFEGIVSNYPKRVDIWNVFIDMERLAGDVDAIRRLFERVIKLKVSSKKMKYFFKRYLEFEKSIGSGQGVEHVREAAKAYVDRVSEE
ncbi:hypothetical protein SeLEV6574_g07938, partial [Synchytrium endobioticum]